MEQNNTKHEQERFNPPSAKEQEHILVSTTKLLPTAPKHNRNSALLCEEGTFSYSYRKR